MPNRRLSPKRRTSLSPAERSLIGRYGAHKKWSEYDPVEGTEPARAAGPGRIDYWLQQVDPDGKLPEKERLRRAESAKKAHYTDLALRSVEARRKGRSDAA